MMALVKALHRGEVRPQPAPGAMANKKKLICPCARPNKGSETARVGFLVGPSYLPVIVG